MYPHRIRLRGPWECEPVARAGSSLPLPPPHRITLPYLRADDGLTDFPGRIRFRRRFGYPGRIDEGERVWLTCDGIDGSVIVTLNGERLGEPADPADGFEYDVTARLAPRNELLLEVEGPAGGGVRGEVALEIRRTAFLRAVVIRHAEGRLTAEGLVAGEAERPLELYLLLGRSTVAYGTAMPSPEGKRFVLEASASPLDGAERVRLDLVDGATVWYTLERTVEPSASP